MKKSFRKINQVMRDVQVNLVENYSGELANHFSTGFEDLDKFIVGLCRKEVVVIGGLPNMGKSSLLMNIVKSISKDYGKNVSIAFFSLEKTVSSLGISMLSSESEIPVHQLRSGKLSNNDWCSLAEANARLDKTNVYLYDSLLSVDALYLKCQELYKENGLDIVVVDSLQLLQSDDEYSFSKLKSLSERLNVAVLVTSTIKYSEAISEDICQTRSNFNLMGVEQYADVIFVVHTPEVESLGESASCLSRVLVIKNMNGAIGEVLLKFVGKIHQFEKI